MGKVNSKHMSILIPVIINLQKKKLTTDKEGYFVMTKQLRGQEDIKNTVQLHLKSKFHNA